MELGLLNLISSGGGDDAGLALPETVDGAAFTALLAQLGLAPATPAAPGAPAPSAEEVAARLAGLPAAMLALTPAAKVAADPAAAPEAVPANDAATEDAAHPLDLAALGLPPLMAAQLAPTTLTPASTTPASSVAAGASLPAGTGVATTPAAAAVPVAGLLEIVPTASLPAALTELAQPGAAERPAPVELAALAAVMRRTSAARPAAPLAGGEPAAKGDGAAAAAGDPVSLAIVRTPQPPVAALAPLVDTHPAAPTGVDPAPALELPIEAQLDLARDGEWLDQLAKDIARTATGDGPLRFKLNPEHLGSLRVEVTQGAAGASVRVTADTEAARTLIADARPQLMAEARAQGVRIAEAHVDLGSGSQSHGGSAQRDGRGLPEPTYLTSWQPESAEENATPPQRSASERYA